METQTTLAAADAAGPPPQMLQYLRFTSGGEACALRIESVREILEVSQVTPLPLVPSFVHGVMNLRGAVVPVFDLGVRLGLPPIQIGRRSCIVVVDLTQSEADDENGGPREHTLGLLVDAVHEVFDCSSTEVEPVPRLGMRVAPGYLRSVVRSQGRATPELDLATTLDLQAIHQLIDRHIERH